MLKKILPLRSVFGTNRSSSFFFPGFYLNTPRRSTQFSNYLQTHSQLSQYFKPIYDQKGTVTELRAHDLQSNGVRYILQQKHMPIALYTTKDDLTLLLNGAVINKRHVAIVCSSVFQSNEIQSDDTHYHAIVYEKESNGAASLFVYDPYRDFKVSSSMQTLLSKLNITLHKSDTPRSYALKGTSFAYAINDADMLLQSTAVNTHDTYTSKDGHDVFILPKKFRYNGLKAKKEYFQMMVDTVKENCSDSEFKAPPLFCHLNSNTRHTRLVILSLEANVLTSREINTH